MAPSRQVHRKQRTGSVKRQSERLATKPPRSTPWPTIEAFLDAEEGDITLGSIGYNSSLGYTAVACDKHNMLVALLRQPGEPLRQLLDRLECALGRAIEDQVFVDEINGPS